MASGSLCPSPYQTVLDANGNPVSGAKITTTLAGTATPVATFTDQALTVSNANPIIADSAGRYVAFLTPGVGYKFAIADAASVPIRTVDGILAAPATPFNVASGGTGAVTFTAHGVLIGEGTSAIAATGAGTALQVLTSNGAAADPTFQAPQIDNGVNDFDLTLTSATPITIADVLAATSIFATPNGKGNRIALYDNVGAPTIYSTVELSIAVPNVANQMYDVFCFANAGVPTLELLAWATDTARATNVVLTTTGAYTKSGDLTRRLLGSFRTTAVAGQTEDSATKRYVSNVSRRARRPLLKQEATATWNYTLAAFRQANGAAANQVDVVVSVPGALLDLSVAAAVANATAAVAVAVNIGEDSTTVAIDSGIGGFIDTAGNINIFNPLNYHLTKTPAVGRHFYAWLEFSTATGTSTWLGSLAGVGTMTRSSGLAGWIEG